MIANMNFNILGYILIALIAIICIRVYQSSDSFQLNCIVSEVDGNKYCVRERAKLVMAADLLAQCTVNMKKLVEHMEKTYPDQDNVRRLVAKFDPKQVCETLPTSEFTAYSENKGEKLAVCLNTTKEGTKLKYTRRWITRTSPSSTAALKSTTTLTLMREGRAGSFSGCMLSSWLRKT